MIDAPTATARPEDGGTILAGLLVAALSFGGFGTWAALAPLSSAVIASGHVRVDSHRKTVQHLEGGIIREILVREGDEVPTGAVLLRLDDTQSGATLDLLRGQHDALKALEARLEAERDGRAAVAFPPTLDARRGDPRVAAILSGQETIFASRRGALDSQFDILRQRVEQLRAEIGGYRAQVASLTAQAGLIQSELKSVEELVALGFERRPRLLALQREAASLAGNRGQQLGLIAKAEQSIGEADMQRASLVSTRANEVATELRDAQTKLVDIEERLRAALHVQGRTEILTPQAGRIVNLRHFTAGGVLRAGEAIVDLVPLEDKLVIEARIQPLDIDSVHQGLPAEIRLSAFRQRRTPMLQGTVTHVSADSLTDERSGVGYYVAQVEIGADQMARTEGIKLYPGMPVEVMIVTGARTALDYFFEPVRDSFRRAFRED
jgi:HlyD family type I secretion membrane fusion protein